MHCLLYLFSTFFPSEVSEIRNSTIKHISTYTLTEFPTKKEPCLTPTLMDEGQDRNPNTTYNGYKMEFWKFALTWKLICPVQHKITKKEQKETTKK